MLSGVIGTTRLMDGVTLMPVNDSLYSAGADRPNDRSRHVTRRPVVESGMVYSYEMTPRPVAASRTPFTANAYRRLVSTEPPRYAYFCESMKVPCPIE